MSKARTGRPGLVPYVLASALSLLIAVFIFMAIALGECLPRDDSEAMHMCDVAKAFEIRAFPSMWLILLLAAPFVGRKWPALGLPLILLAPFLSIALVLLW